MKRYIKYYKFIKNKLAQTYERDTTGDLLTLFFLGISELNEKVDQADDDGDDDGDDSEGF